MTYRSAFRQIRVVLIGFTVMFVICWGYWSWAEASLAGRQFADPLFPCLFVACLGAQVALAIHLFANTAANVWRQLARRRRSEVA